MDAFVNEHLFAVLGIAVNVGIAWLAMKTRADMAELKVFMFENFERIKRR